MHQHVDVDRAAHVPAGVERVEDRKALGVGRLDTAHVRLAERVLRSDARVEPGRARVPDLDGGALDRRARGGVQDRELQRERRPGEPVGDVAAHLFARHVVRALRHLRREHAGERSGGDGGGAEPLRARRRGAVGGEASQEAASDHRSDEAAEPEQGASPGDGGGMPGGFWVGVEQRFQGYDLRSVGLGSRPSQPAGRVTVVRFRQESPENPLLLGLPSAARSDGAISHDREISAVPISQGCPPSAVWVAGRRRSLRLATRVPLPKGTRAGAARGARTRW